MEHRVSLDTLNEFVQALDAAGEGGTIEIAIGVEEERIRLSVEDSGLGISPDGESAVAQGAASGRLNAYVRIAYPSISAKAAVTTAGWARCWTRPSRMR